MPIYRKNSNQNAIWWIDIRTPGGKRVRRSTGTRSKKEAQEYHDRLKAELWRENKLGDKPDYTFDEAAIQVLKLAVSERDYGVKARHIRYWRDHFGGRTLSSLTAEEIINCLPTHQLPKPGVKGNLKLSKATQNRYLSTMSRLLNLAYKDGRIDRLPHLTKFKEAPVRVRWITREQAQLLIQQLSQRWMRNAVIFALSTGARANEILSLEWSQVDLNEKVAWLTADKTKSGKARPIPLNDDTCAVLKSCQGDDPSWVFVRNTTGQNPKTINHKSFNAATKAVGLDDFHFHDLRHTWASWHVQAGTPLFVLKEMGGCETLEMVKKYAHLNASHLAEYSSVLTFWSPLDDLKPPTKEKAA